MDEFYLIKICSLNYFIYKNENNKYFTTINHINKFLNFDYIFVRF